MDPAYRRHMMMGLRAYRKMPRASCPLCGYTGKFDGLGTITRFGAGCPKCGSAERHRLLALAIRDGFVSFADKDILHFAPEPVIVNAIQSSKPRSYISADIEPGRADLVLDITNIALDDDSLDIVMASHVLEHVDDGRALSEIRRILRPGGQAVLMVPIIEGWNASYEDASVTSPVQRLAHFDKEDHIRFYGQDFRDRILRTGFSLQEYTADGLASVRFGLLRGEKVFIATKV
jgi:SAM-dependent methyltransferase